MSILLELFEQFNAAFSFSYLFIITIILACSITLLFKWYMTPPNKHGNLPPSPPGFPLIGNLHQLGSLPHRSLSMLAKRHGNLMLLRFGRVPVLVASSADTASEIMKTHDIVFANRPKSSIFKRLVYDFHDVATASYGEYWRQAKSILVIHLLNNAKVKTFKNVREEETSLMLDRIKQAANTSSPINFSDMLVTFVNDIVCRTSLGKKYSGHIRGRTLKGLLAEFTELLGAFDFESYIPWLNWVNKITGIDSRIDKLASELDDFLDSIVEEHSGNEGNDLDRCKSEMDMVDILLMIQKKNILSFPLERISIKALILDMFIAGTDTTNAVIEWAMTELLRHPDCMKKLQKEVQDIAEGDKLLSEKDLDDTKYLKAVIKETLRLHPPLTLLLMRESSEDVRVGGYNIAAGTQVIVNAWAIGRDPSSWEKPEEFWPERFVNSSIDFRGQDLQFIPFGSGRRLCPGIQYSSSIIELALANFVHKFDWSLCRTVTTDDDMAETAGLTAHRRYPLIVLPSSRLC